MTTKVTVVNEGPKSIMVGVTVVPPGHSVEKWVGQGTHLPIVEKADEPLEPA